VLLVFVKAALISTGTLSKINFASAFSLVIDPVSNLNISIGVSHLAVPIGHIIVALSLVAFACDAQKFTLATSFVAIPHTFINMTVLPSLLAEAVHATSSPTSLVDVAICVNHLTLPMSLAILVEVSFIDVT
jgi:hypothetical protein